jgi:hypothetical protein
MAHMEIRKAGKRLCEIEADDVRLGRLGKNPHFEFN